jgi:hypothetical protein
MPKMEQELPILPNARIERDDVMIAKSATLKKPVIRELPKPDKALPSCMKERHDNVDPKLTKSRIETDDPRRTIPKADTDDPQRTKERKDAALPRSR